LDSLQIKIIASKAKEKIESISKLWLLSFMYDGIYALIGVEILNVLLAPDPHGGIVELIRI
jgi:hypothetical protein